MVFKFGSIVITGLLLAQCTGVKSGGTSTDTSQATLDTSTTLSTDSSASKLIDSVGIQMAAISTLVTTDSSTIMMGSVPMAKFSDADVTAIKEAMTQEALANSLGDASGTDAEVVTKLSAKLIMAGVKSAIAQGKITASKGTLVYEGVAPASALRLAEETKDQGAIAGIENASEVDTSDATVSDALNTLASADASTGNSATGSFGSADAITTQIAGDVIGGANLKTLSASDLQAAAEEAASRTGQLYYAMTFANAYVRGVHDAFPSLPFEDAQSSFEANLTDFSTTLGALAGATSEADLVGFQEFIRTTVLGFLSLSYGDSAADAIAKATQASYDACVAAVKANPPADVQEGFDIDTMAQMMCSGALNNIGDSGSQSFGVKYSDLSEEQQLALATQTATDIYSYYTNYIQSFVEDPTMSAEDVSMMYDSLNSTAASIISMAMNFTEQSDLTAFGSKVLNVLLSMDANSIVPAEDANFRSHITGVLQLLSLNYWNQGSDGDTTDIDIDVPPTVNFTLTSATYQAVESTDNPGYYDINVTITGTGLTDMVSTQLFGGNFPLNVTFNDAADGGCAVNMDTSSDTQLVCTISQPTPELLMDSYPTGMSADTHLLSKVTVYVFDENNNYQGASDFLTSDADWTYVPAE